jgi:cytochrome b6-f complex iron-sulfur subunit
MADEDTQKRILNDPEDRETRTLAEDTPPELHTEGGYYLVKVQNPVPTHDGHIAGDEESGIMALSHICTHLGCPVPFDQQQNAFDCPCHGARFDRSGNYLGGPAPRNMDQFAVSVQPDGAVVVDTTRKYDGKPRES